MNKGFGMRFGRQYMDTFCSIVSSFPIDHQLCQPTFLMVFSYSLWLAMNQVSRFCRVLSVRPHA